MNIEQTIWRLPGETQTVADRSVCNMLRFCFSPPFFLSFLLLAENSLSVFLSLPLSLFLLLVLYNLRILGFGNLITVQCLHCSPSRPGNKLPIVAAQSFYLSRDLGVRHPCDARHPRAPPVLRAFRYRLFRQRHDLCCFS